MSDAGEELALGIAAADCWQLGYDGVEDCGGVGAVFVGEGRNAYAWLAAWWYKCGAFPGDEMTTSSDGLPLNLRKKDIFFVACFSFFAFSSFFSDSLHALGLLDGDGFWPRATRWYGEIAQDHFFLADHKFLRVNTGISGMVYGPFYLLLVYAFIKGKNWIRPMALVYVGAMLHGCTEYFIYEYWIGPPPGNAFLFWAINGPYWVIPFMLGVRMWKPDPFGAAPA